MSESDMERIRQLVKERDSARHRAGKAEALLNDAIRSALKNGATVIDLAELTGLTRARIYQIRDGRR